MSRSALSAKVFALYLFVIGAATFAALGLASPMVILFAVPDLLGAIWTHLARKAEDGTAAPVLASHG